MMNVVYLLHMVLLVEEIPAFLDNIKTEKINFTPQYQSGEKYKSSLHFNLDEFSKRVETLNEGYDPSSSLTSG